MAALSSVPLSVKWEYNTPQKAQKGLGTVPGTQRLLIERDLAHFLVALLRPRVRPVLPCVPPEPWAVVHVPHAPVTAH